MNKESKVLDENEYDNFDIELITLDGEFLGDSISIANSKAH